MERENLDQLCIETVRMLAVDAIEEAKSGHPGLPMGAAPMAYILWTRHMKYNPANPGWFNRDRFILSGGHGSMLLYALLHLSGYDLSLDDLKAFRQWGSKTPGHPESHLTPGVEVATGPLGQGISNAVGIALAEAHLAARFNRPDFSVVDHYTYVLSSDGDLMEGVVSEACSLAGHLKLGKLIVLYDDNGISLAGSTALSFTEDTRKRYEAYHWHVQSVEDGNDLAAIDQAIERAKKENLRPSIIFVRTVIGQGSPHKEGTSEAHGAPLGPQETLETKKHLGWPAEPAFLIPEKALKVFRTAIQRGKDSEASWKGLLDDYTGHYPDLAGELTRRSKGELPQGWDANLPEFPADSKAMATRKASETIMQSLASRIPEIMGGSADLNPSTFTWLKGFGDCQSPEIPHQGIQGLTGGEWGYGGRNIHFGVREHAMGSIAVGMAAHGGIVPYTATFLVFADYMRPPIRLAALTGGRVIFIFSHDSIAVGEDGPTHQPIEHLLSLRAIPNVVVLRPADANETLAAWRFALEEKKRPVVLVTTRQNVPVLDPGRFSVTDGVKKGGYVLLDEGKGNPDIILMATGSEVHLALEAASVLSDRGVKTRVVSMPSLEVFEEQPEAYRNRILPRRCRKRLAIEAGRTLGWWRWVGDKGNVIGVDRFGASAPGGVIMEKFGFTADNVVKKALTLLNLPC